MLFNLTNHVSYYTICLADKLVKLCHVGQVPWSKCLARETMEPRVGG